MKLNIGAAAAAAGLFWGGAIFLVGVANLAAPGYGRALLELAASLYPGYKAAASLGQVLVATLYGLVDGAVSGAILAWLYNRLCAVFRAPA
ncbi:MAG TPA: hypothetical protein VNK67_09395 [Burkholderiales bacterium]|nr:hypothetical protein [Burkholderiales bacterium]